MLYLIEKDFVLLLAIPGIRVTVVDSFTLRVVGHGAFEHLLSTGLMREAGHIENKQKYLLAVKLGIRIYSGLAYVPSRGR